MELKLTGEATRHLCSTRGGGRIFPVNKQSKTWNTTKDQPSRAAGQIKKASAGTGKIFLGEKGKEIIDVPYRREGHATPRGGEGGGGGRLSTLTF